MDEADMHPAGDECCLTLGDFAQQPDVAVGMVEQFGVVPANGVVGELPQLALLSAGGKVLEGADSQMARGNARQDGARKRVLAEHRLARADGRERARCRNLERVHRLAEDGFSQHRADGGLAVAAARKRGSPRALEGDVAPTAVAVNDLAEQERPTVAERRRETAELVPRIGLSDGRRALWRFVARENRAPAVAGERLHGQAELFGERSVEPQHRRRRNACRLPRHRQARQFTCV